MSQGGRQDPGYGNGYGDEYAEDEDDYYTYDATDEDEEGRRPLVILAIIALIVVFAGVVFLAYKQGLRQGAQGNPPIIRADSNPVKVAPTNPGGIQIPHQDRAVYDRLSGSTDTTKQDAEHLLPTPEEPMTMATPETVVPAAPSATAPTIPAPTSTVVVEPAPVTPAKPVPEPVAVATPAGTGGYVVQLAAFRDEPSARAAFAKLQSKFPALKPLGADIQRADLGAKGVYYRLRAGFLSKADATTLCDGLAAKGQACFVRPK